MRTNVVQGLFVLGLGTLLVFCGEAGPVVDVENDQVTIPTEFGDHVVQGGLVEAEGEIGELEQSSTSCKLGGVPVPGCHSCDVVVGGKRYGSSIRIGTKSQCASWCNSTCQISSYYFVPGRYWSGYYLRPLCLCYGVDQRTCAAGTVRLGNCGCVSTAPKTCNIGVGFTKGSVHMARHTGVPMTLEKCKAEADYFLKGTLSSKYPEYNGTHYQLKKYRGWGKCGTPDPTTLNRGNIVYQRVKWGDCTYFTKNCP